jgi:Matrixin
MRPLAVLGAVAALVAAANIPYVRSQTNRDSVDGGHCLAWPAGTVEVHPNADGAPERGDTGFTALERALGTWEAQMQACGNLALVMGGRSTSRIVGFDDRQGGATNENLVVFRTRLCSEVVPRDDPCLGDGTCANSHDCWDFAPGTLAITTTTYNTNTGRLYDADLEMNAAAHLFTTVDSPPCIEAVEPTCVSVDVQNTATHEFGHSLGLAHSPDPRSTMFAGANPGETSKRILDDGSKEFVCTAYPQGSQSRDCDGSPLVLAEEGGSCSAAPVGTLGLVAALFRLFRRRGRN